MANICTSKYTFHGITSEISRLHKVLNHSDYDHVSLAFACQNYVDSSCVDYARADICSISDFDSECSVIELELASAWREPEGVFEALITSLGLNTIEWGYYAVEPASGYAKAYATSSELYNSLPEYYYDFYMPGVNCMEDTVNSLDEMIKIFNNSLAGLDGWVEVEGEPYLVSDYLVADGSEHTLMHNCYKLNKKFATDESEWHSTILKF